MGAKSRRKGASGERELAELARAYGFTDAKRSLAQARDGAERDDINDALPSIWAEVKRYRVAPIQRAMRQAQEAAAANGNARGAVAFTRSNGGPWLATTSATLFLALLATRERLAAENARLEAALRETLESAKGAA